MSRIQNVTRACLIATVMAMACGAQAQSGGSLPKDDGLGPIVQTDPQSFVPPSVPEPGTWSVLAMGVVGVAGFAWRRRRLSR